MNNRLLKRRLRESYMYTSLNYQYNCLFLIQRSQKWLAVVSLSRPVGDENEGPPKALRKLARQNKYEIKTVLWNPHPAKVDLLASTVSGLYV